MGKTIHITKFILLGFLLLSFLGGCAVYDAILGVKPEDKRPEELITEGMAKLEKGDYEGATEYFQTIKDRYPYSRFAILAELKMADSLYKVEDFGGAFDAYDEFEKLHPKDKNIPYVIFQKGMCSFRQVKSIDRDQTHTLKAKNEFERLVKRFPRDYYSDKARGYIRKCLIYLAEYELYVAHFYFKMGEYGAAMKRYMYIIQNYPDMGQYHEALEYISKSKIALAEEEKE